MMNRIAPVIIGSALLLAGAAYLNAQVVPAPGPPTPIACAYNTSPPTLSNGQAGWVQCTNDGKMQVDASVTAEATISGWQPQATGTPIAADSDGDTQTLASGSVVVLFNRSTTVSAYCALGASSTLNASQVAPQSAVAFTVGAATQVTCITASSTATINQVGGTGLPTGWGGGGGSGGGGGGAITAPLGTTAIADAVAVQPATSSTWAATQSGTWTMQPGNTANTTPWLQIIRDAAGNARGANVDASNRLMVGSSSGGFPSGSFASGSFATGAMTDLLTMRQSMAAGSPASNSIAAGGQYRATPITLTDTQGSALQLDANGYLKVNVATGGGSGGTSSSYGAAFPGTGTAAGFTDGTNMVAGRVGAIDNMTAATNFVNTISGCEYNATPVTVTDTRYQGLQCDVNGFLRVSVVSATGLAQGSTTSGQTGSLVMGAVTTGNPTYTTAQTSPLSLTTTGGLRVSPNATASGGSSTTGNIAANNTTAVVVKASAGTLYGVQVYGIGSAPAYLKIYNATSATCGSGTPVKRIMIPAASTAANGAGSNVTFGPAGVAFTTGITYCVTTGIADNDTSAPAASTFLINVDWL